jgi:hypothetical protein
MYPEIWKCGFFFSRTPFNWRRKCGNLRQERGLIHLHKADEPASFFALVEAAGELVGCLLEGHHQAIQRRRSER